MKVKEIILKNKYFETLIIFENNEDLEEIQNRLDEFKGIIKTLDYTDKEEILINGITNRFKIKEIFFLSNIDTIIIE